MSGVLRLYNMQRDVPSDDDDSGPIMGLSWLPEVAAAFTGSTERQAVEQGRGVFNPMRMNDCLARGTTIEAASKDILRESDRIRYAVACTVLE